MALSERLEQMILQFQENEITEYHIYSNLARRTRDPENNRILQHIAEDEHRHYGEWKEQTGKEVPANQFKVWWYTLLGRLLGITFALKLMERGEEGAQDAYGELVTEVPVAKAILADEDAHEEALLGMLDEERLRYTGSIVLGLNDALVELTGALAGLTLALQNTTLIALTASITGIAASMSMAASEYLSTKAEETSKTPGRAALYTGLAYVFTVLVLVLPYLLFDNLYLCLGLSLLIGVLIIASFTYYISVAEDQPFRRRFLEMAGLSLSIAALSFGIGYLIRELFGVEV
ncbi:MAG: VIT1/CCC1 transporter family protein [Anaerolineae bacterium]|nr:VIT1/CCC1 transporter family protein [Anaerolineae bacterium]